MLEHARQHHAGTESAQPGGTHMFRRAQIKIPNTKYKNISDDDVEKSPQHVHGRRGEPLSRRFGKGTLKRSPHYPADQMREGVYKKSAAEEVGNVVNPFHRQSLLLRTSMISWVVPVSPSFGKIRAMLLTWA